MELAPNALNDPAWDSMQSRGRDHAHVVLETICQTFQGVLVGPGPLVRHLVDEGRLGHRSALEALTRLVAHGLLDHREADGTPVFWVPNRLIAHARAPTREPPRPPPRRNGADRPRLDVRR